MQETQRRRTPRSGGPIMYPGLLLLSLAAGAGLIQAQPAAEPAPEVKTASPAVLTFAACRQIALERQPAVAAAQASLAAAIARNDALEHLHTPGLLSHDLPIRRQQASLGVTVAEALLHQAESEAVFSVQYCYLAYLYATQQRKVANEARDNLQQLRTVAQETLKAEERRDVFPEHLDLIDSYLKVVTGREQDAIRGQPRALAALREAMGVGCDFAFVLPERDLPCPQVEPTKDQIVALALARRGEIVQAATAEQIVGLEVDAQHAICLPSGRTFAAGSDIHARPIRVGTYGPEYRPGALALEMPTTLAGSKHARMEQAEHYHERAEAVAAKTHQLVTLEAEDAFLLWQENSVKAKELREAAQKSQVFSDRLKKKYEPRTRNGYPSLGDMLSAGVVTSRLKIEALEAQFQSLVDLAALERITAGGFCVDFDALCK